ncbi:MAG: hypothetical protein ACJ8GK_09870 [Luteimonas sp.]
MTLESTRAPALRNLRVLTLLLVPLALAYIVYASADHLGELRAVRVSPIGVAGFVLLGTLSIALSTLYHARLVAELANHRGSRQKTALAYAIGQIVRYLPGKVLGLVFQASYLRGQIPAASITLAMLAQMALAYFCAGMVAAVILGVHALGAYWPCALLAPAAALVWCANRHAWVETTLQRVPYVGRRMLGVALQPRSMRSATALTLLLLLNWLPFLAGWAWLLRSSHSLGEALVFAAAYLAASIASTAMIVVPSGLVVREAIFIWIGAQAGLPTSELLLYSVLARLALTAADLLNAVLFWALDRYRVRRERIA